jgi:hypothetical protein
LNHLTFLRFTRCEFFSISSCVLSLFPLFTSIRPPACYDELAYLRDCLNSWRVAEFRPIAVNGPVETEVLRGLDLPVEFSPMPTDGRPRIGAILSAIRASGSRFAGIINSDCKIVGYPNLAPNLAAGLEGRAAVAWRLDVGGRRPTAQRYGFDAFFVDTAVMPDDDAGFSIGEPFWDTWFPIACEAAGARVEAIEAPLLTHKVHPLNWNDGAWLRGAQRFWPAFRVWHACDILPETLIARLPAKWLAKPMLSFSQLRHVSAVIPVWLREDRPQTISIVRPQAGETEAMLRLAGKTLLATSYGIEIEIGVRITRPLRSAVNVIRGLRLSLLDPRRGRLAW